MRLFAIALLALGSGFAAAAEAPLKLGDIEGMVHAPFANGETKAVVLVFVSTDCPIANYYQPTLRRLQKEFQGVAFFQVHPDPETPVAEVRKHAGEFEVAASVVIDAGQAARGWESGARNRSARSSPCWGPACWRVVPACNRRWPSP